MQKEYLGDQEKEILSRCVVKHAPHLAYLIDHLENASKDQINEMRSAIGDEFCEKGLREDDEPNKYGLKLDDLIGKLADLYIWPEKKKGKPGENNHRKYI